MNQRSKKDKRGGARSGAGRPKGEATKLISIRPPVAQIKAIKDKNLKPNTSAYVSAMDAYLKTI